MRISLDPEPEKKSYRLVAILVVILLGAALLWLQKDRLLGQIESLPGQAQLLPAASLAAPTPTSPSQVKLVYSTVVTMDNTAFTAGLYLEEAEHPDGAELAGIAGRMMVETYTVQAGDTLWGVAAQFGLDLDTLRWSNPELERNPDLLSLGTELIILPVVGAYYTVSEGDTLEEIAERYGVAEVDIINCPFNELVSPYALQPGDQLVIPNGRKAVTIPPPEEDPDYPLAWPLVGRVTQGYHADHRAIDIGSVYGAKVYAADKGTVIHAEWTRDGYGYTVIIQHNDKGRTLYGHLKGALVHKGEEVFRGQAIGAVGSTDNSTGPHLHFEVLNDGERVDPLDYLKPK